jgi:PKD domain-containing protein
MAGTVVKRELSGLTSVRSGGPAALARVAMPVAAVLVLLVLAMPAAAASGIQVSINGVPGPFISAAMVTNNADVEPQPGQSPPFDAGMSLKLLSEMVGVAPDVELNGNPANYTLIGIDVGDAALQPRGSTSPVGVSQLNIMAGYPDALGHAYYAVFYVTGLGVELGTPVPGGGALPTHAYTENWEADGILPVDIENFGTVLGVPQPVFDVCTPDIGQAVGFSMPVGGVVTLGQQSGAPADTDGLRYSWDFGDGSPATALSSSDTTTHAFAAPGTYDVRLTAVDAANNAGVSPVAAQVVVGTSQGTPGACGQVPGAGNSPTGGHGGNHPGSPSSGSHGAPATGGGTGGPSALSSGAATGSVHATTTKTAPRKTGPAPTSSAPKPSSSNGSATAGGGNGGGHGGSGGGRGGGGAAGSHGAGTAASGPAGGHGVTGSLASGAVVPGSGAGRTKPPTHSVHPAGPAPANLTGVLIESLGSPVSGGVASASSNPLSLLQSVARASSGGGGSGGLPAWILGVVSLIALLVLGVVRESGPGVSKWLGTHRRSGSGHLHAGAA